MKKITYRDGPIRDGAPTRVEHDMAEMSDLTGEPWQNPDGTPAADTSNNIQYTAGNAAVGTFGASLGVESSFQSSSSVAGEKHLQTSWIYATAIEAANEKGTASTAVIVGSDGNYNVGTDQVSIVTVGARRLTVNSAGQLNLARYGVTSFNDNAAVKVLGVQADGDVVQVDPDSLAGDFTVIDNIDLKPTGTANQFTIEVTWTDGDGVVHTTTDPTPIDVVDSQSPWDNPDNTAADQSSGDIKYTAGNVGIGVTPAYGLHVGQADIYAKDFTTSGGSVTQYIQRANDGVGNFQQYWNTLGTGAATRISNGPALNEEFSANSDWYQVRGAGTDVLGSAITWTNIHYYNMATGQHWFPEYGVGQFPNTNPAYLLGVGANGVVVEVDPDTLGADDTDDQTLSTSPVSDTEVEVIISEGNSITLSLDKTFKELYEYRDIWAEESGAVDAGSAEWSFGNGATGYMGLPIDAGWEVESMYFQADTYPATATVQVDLMDYGNVPSNAAANTITSISLASATDGDGGTNNGYKYEVLTSPVPISISGGSTLLGFITRSATGAISDARVGARLRRSVGKFVTDVTLG